MSPPDSLQIYQACIEETLDKWLPQQTTDPTRLHAAMRYSVLGNGKRIRPLLLYATGEALGVDKASLHGPAAAVEIIHAYSLIHDDLPAMDDDDLRRGRPTCHKHYDEATAILAGDALQALAFHILATDPDIQVPPEQRIHMIKRLTAASGSEGMAGGQAIDLHATGKKLTLKELQKMHAYKTGALIRASCELGALSLPGINTDVLQQTAHYGECIGLAFQIQDDIIDIESDTETLGKPQGSDAQQNKPTYPELLGIDGAKQAAQKLYIEALSCLESFGAAADTLRTVSALIVERNK